MARSAVLNKSAARAASGVNQTDGTDLRVRIAIVVLLFLFAWGQAAAQVSTLVFCSRESPDSFNPQLSVSQATFDASARQVYDRLVMFAPDSADIVPALAESWRISEDGREYVFRLRPGVQFHTTRGFRPTRSLNAEDVVFSFLRQRDAKHPWHKVSGGGYRYFVGMGLDKLIESVTAVDEMTVTFRLTQPNASFLAILAMDFASVLSAEYAAAMMAADTPEILDREPVGTGPFALVQYQRDALIRYVAHREYWRGPAPVENLVFAVTPDAAVRVQKLRDGECHVIDRPDPADLPAILTDPALAVARQTGADLGYLAFNTQKPFLKDVRVRRALALAIDRQAVVDRAYGGFGVAAARLLPPGIWGNEGGITLVAPNRDRARDLLAAAGVENLTVDIWAMPVSRTYMPSARRVAESIQADWAAIGVEATITVNEWDRFLKLSMVGEHDAILFGWIAETLDPDVFLTPILSCTAAYMGANRSRWCHPGLDRLLLQGRQAKDRFERKTIYEFALEILEKQVPLVPLAHSMSFTPHRSNVIGYTVSPLGGHYFYGVDLK